MPYAQLEPFSFDDHFAALSWCFNGANMPPRRFESTLDDSLVGHKPSNHGQLSPARTRTQISGSVPCI
jgi:hypothetical protein